MRKIFVMSIILTSLIFIGCNDSKSKIDKETFDELTLYIQKLDSLVNCGSLVHCEYYKIGKIKSVYFNVCKISTSNDTVCFLEINKNIDNRFYSFKETGYLAPSEIKYMENAINVILSNLDRSVRHEERYIYVSKNKIKLSAIAVNPKNWSISLSVDYIKENTSIELSKNELIELKELLKSGEAKINEIK